MGTFNRADLIGKTVEEAREICASYGLDIKVCGKNVAVPLNESSLKVDVWVGEDGKIIKA